MISERRSPPAKPMRQNGAVAQPAQVHVEVAEHGEQFVGEDRFLLNGRPAVLAADASEHGGDMAVAGVERVAELAVMPANPGKAALQRGDARSASAPSAQAAR